MSGSFRSYQSTDRYSDATYLPNRRRMPILHGSQNYQRWAEAWEALLERIGLWGLISGENKEPEEKNTNEWRMWRNQNVKLRGILLNAVDEDLQIIVIDTPSVKEAWDRIKVRYDRYNVNTTIGLLRSFLSLSFQNNNSIPSYLLEFSDAWSRLRERVRTSKTPLGRILQIMTADDRIKGAFLMCSFPKSMDTFIDTLATEREATFDNVHSKLLELSMENSARKNKPVFKVTERKKKEYRWCKSKIFKFKAHK